MRVIRGAVAVGVGLLVPVLSACGSPPRQERAPVVAEFSEGNGAAARAQNLVAQKHLNELESCRKTRQQGVYARERSFPCEAFLGE